MISQSLLPFEGAFNNAARYGKPSLLLGNGFSRAWDNSRFDYERLYDVAAIPGRIKAIMDRLGFKDFEATMRALNLAQNVINEYRGGEPISLRIAEDIDVVRSALLRAVWARHPESSRRVSDDQYQSCFNFLAPFSNLFSLNYDLLLYWTINWAISHQQCAPNQFDDGFRKSDGRLLWRSALETQNVHYMHGGFHLISAGEHVSKLSSKDAKSSIAEQMEHYMRAGALPLFISEGESLQKAAAIAQSPYLRHCHDTLSRHASPLFTFGVKFSPADDHILESIAASSIPALYVGVRALPNEEHKGRIADKCIKRRDALQNLSPHWVPLKVFFYEVTNCRVWG